MIGGSVAIQNKNTNKQTNKQTKTMCVRVVATKKRKTTAQTSESEKPFISLRQICTSRTAPHLTKEGLAAIPSDLYDTIQKYLSGYPHLDNKQLILFSTIKRWHLNDVLAEYKPYDQCGQLHGVWQKWFPNGKLSSTKQYVCGVLNGPSIEYFESGQKKSRLHYKSGQLHGRCKEWKLNINREVVLVSDKECFNGILHGKCSKYSPQTGSLISTFEYAFGKKHGTGICVDVNHHLTIYSSWKNDQKDGTVKEYNNINARLVKSTEYKLDLKHGLCKTWFPENSQLKEKYNYEFNHLEGVQEEYNSNGILIHQFYSSRGVYHGYYNRYYDDTGQLHIQQYYGYGEKIGDEKAWYSNSIYSGDPADSEAKRKFYEEFPDDQLMSICTYSPAGWIIAYRTWFRNGKMMHFSEKCFGVKHGRQKWWELLENGNTLLIREWLYKNGEKHGMCHSYYPENGKERLFVKSKNGLFIHWFHPLHDPAYKVGTNKWGSVSFDENTGLYRSSEMWENGKLVPFKTKVKDIIQTAEKIK